jgi:alkylation response protein AidB-like acyl-CoA dehydrogenase
MELRYSPEAEAFREKVQAFLAEHLPVGWAGIGAIADRDEAERFVATWRQTLAANRLLGLSWPEQYGGAGLSKLEQVVLAEEFARAGVPTMGPNDTFGIKMLGNTLIRWGTEEQKRRFLPRILSGDDTWCQGYSEPDAGSDLAGLKTRAALDGDHWVLDGQKIWTSKAVGANWIFVLARTEPTAPKHGGITFLLVPLHQPGIEIRPITMLSGEGDFNEVFFTGATTDAENVVGQVNGGWAVAQTLLGHERGEEAATNPVLFRAELDRLIRLARHRGKLGDPVVRDRLVQAYVRCEVMRFLGARILTGVLHGGGTLGPQASISKLYWSEYHRDVTRLALDVLGADALIPTGRGPMRPYRTDDPGAPNTTGSWVGAFYNAVAGTIYAGTSEIQRNIIAENVLGLPRGRGGDRG